MLKIVLRNSVFLFVIKVLNLGSPLLLIPILTANVDVGEVGKLFYFQALALWGAIFVEYGFNLTATRRVAQESSEVLRSEIFNRVFVTKCALILPLVLVLNIAYFFASPDLKSWDFFLLSIASAFLQGLSPVWFFHGVEKMKEALKIDSIINLSYFFVASLLVILTKQAVIVILVQVLARFFVYVLVYSRTLTMIVNYKYIIEELRLGSSVFLFRLISGLYTKSTALVLGAILPSNEVAYYVGGEKVAKGATGLMSPVTQALFPRMSSLVYESPKEARRLMLKACILLGGVSVFVAFCFFSMSEVIVALIFGRGYEAVADVIEFMSLLIPLITFSNLFGVQILLPLGREKEFNWIIISAAVVHVTVIYPTIYSWGYVGAALQIVVVEAYVAVGMFILTIWKTDFWKKYD